MVLVENGLVRQFRLGGCIAVAGLYDSYVASMGGVKWVRFTDFAIRCLNELLHGCEAVVRALVAVVVYPFSLLLVMNATESGHAYLDGGLVCG